MTQRKRGSRARKADELSLLLREEAPKPYFAAPQFVLTSSFSIGPLLARGCLLANEDELFGEASNTVSGKLLSGEALLARPLVDRVARSARNIIPIAVRLRPGRSIRRIDIYGTGRYLEGICLSDVAAFVFRTQKEMSRFSAVEFGNYSLEALRVATEVDEALFGGPRDGDEVDSARMRATPEREVNEVGVPADHHGDLSQLRDAIRRADALAGVTAYLLSSSPGHRSWMRGVQAVASGKHEWEATWPERLAAAISRTVGEVKDSDRALLFATVETIWKLPVEEGWPGEQVLSDVQQLAIQLAPSDDEAVRREISLWADRAREVLSAKTEPQSLGDDSHILPRAILLLLLRGDLENIATGVAAATGRQRPGPQVLGIASCLAAFRSGARALPSWCKLGSQGEGSGRLLEYVGELFVAHLQDESPTLFPAEVPRPEVAYRPGKALRGEWVATVSGREVARLPAAFDTVLERLLSMGRDLGYDFEEYGDFGLTTRVPASDGRPRPVHLRVLKGDSSAGPVVRFSSPTLKIVGVKSSRLSKELLLDLLMRNAAPNINCRFAVEQEDGPVVVVLADQLLGTLDEAEFKKHVEHVAQVASEFDLSRVPSASPS